MARLMAMEVTAGVDSAAETRLADDDALIDWLARMTAKRRERLRRERERERRAS